MLVVVSLPPLEPIVVIHPFCGHRCCRRGKQGVSLWGLLWSASKDAQRSGAGPLEAPPGFWGSELRFVGRLRVGVAVGRGKRTWPV